MPYCVTTDSPLWRLSSGLLKDKDDVLGITVARVASGLPCVGVSVASVVPVVKKLI